MAEKYTRIQTEKRGIILDAALGVFAENGFRGATLDQIAKVSGLSKPNILYYFPNKEAIYNTLMSQLLETWLEPLKRLEANGDPEAQIMSYIKEKLEFSRDYPRESRLFANEILNGAPRMLPELSGPLKDLVDIKTKVIKGWMDSGQINQMDPYHLIFAIWATTQHYADFAVQVRVVLGNDDEDPISTAMTFLGDLFFKGLRPS